MACRASRSVLHEALVVFCVGVAAPTLMGCDTNALESTGRSSDPIIGGTLDTTHRGVVSLLKQANSGFYPACTGTLLGPNLVLTARHCVAALSSGDGSVQCGTTQFQQMDAASSMLVSVEANVGSDGLRPFRVADVWVPAGSTAVCGGDVALLLLAGSGVPADVATPIEPRLAPQVFDNEPFAAIGYGLQNAKDETGETAGHRMTATDARVFCFGAACGTNLVEGSEFAADSPVCSGDSGGPALDAQGRVIGVTSRGNDACTVAFYSSVSAWTDFIVEKAFVAAQHGNYVAPAWAGEPPAGFDSQVSPPGSGGTSGSATQSGSGGNVSIGGMPPASPRADPLGLSCTGKCPGSYKCWTASGEPPGQCVPACSARQPACPSDFSCRAELGACVPVATPHADSGGCSLVRGGTERGGLGAWAGLVLVAFGAARARRRTSSETAPPSRY